MSCSRLEDFVAESNWIEGIDRSPTTREFCAHIRLLEQKTLTIAAMKKFVAAIEPGAVLRDRHGMDVRIGVHIAPRGGPGIGPALESLLMAARNDGADEAQAVIGLHKRFEHLHPFIDGNGRAGRALALRQLGYMPPGGFLAWWYMLTGAGRPPLARRALRAHYYATLAAHDAAPDYPPPAFVGAAP